MKKGKIAEGIIEILITVLLIWKFRIIVFSNVLKEVLVYGFAAVFGMSLFFLIIIGIVAILEGVSEW